jgi:hypothetical protein
MTTEFHHSAVRPVECLKGGLALIQDQYWLFFGMTLLGMLIGGAAPFGILLGPMMCGLYLCYFSKMRGEPVRFELLFKGFDYFGKSVLAGVAQTAPMFIVIFLGFLPALAIPSMLFQGAHRGQPNGALLGGVFAAIGLFTFLAVMVGSLIALLFAFSYPLIIERHMATGDALKTSARAVLANAGGMLGLFLLNALLGLVLTLLCCVGTYFVLPIVMASYAIAYRSIFPELNADGLR